MWCIDFETRSKVDLKKCGLYKYALDPSTDILCVAFKEDTRPTFIWHSKIKNNNCILDWLLDAVKRGEEIHSHNAEFEHALWNYVAVKRYAFPPIKASQMRCSKARALMLGIPSSLASMAATFGTAVQKDQEGYRLMLKLCKPHKTTGEWVGTAEDFKRLGEYCIRDVETEHACEKLLPPLPPEEQRLWELTIEMNERGILADTEMCKKAGRLLLENDTKLHAEIERLTDGRVHTGRQVQKMMAELEAEGCDLESLDKLAVTTALKDKGLSEKAEAMLAVRQEIGKSSVRKYAAILNQACPDGRVRGTLNFHGAHTGRWAGQGIQPQNFPRGTIKDTAAILKLIELNDLDIFQYIYNVGDALSSALRNMLIAAPGKTFFDGDYSSIEARVLAWLAGDETILKAYGQGVDTYKIMAQMIYNIDHVENVTDDERWLGKKAELGCGYGLGHVKFQKSCLQEGKAISLELAKMAVNTYRNSHAAVVALWHGLEQAAIDAVRTPGVPRTYKRLAYLKKGDFLLCRLPSGRKLWYYKPHLKSEMTKVGERVVLKYTTAVMGKPVVETTYGGHLTGMACQATARDIMAQAMLRLKDAGYDLDLTVHDEILAEVDPNEHTLEEFKEIMEEHPDWTKGIPIKANAWEGPRFKK